MNNIPSTFWMIIISIFTVAIVFLIYYVIQLLKELSDTTKEVSQLIMDLRVTTNSIQEAVDDLNSVIANTKNIFDQAKPVVDNIISPIRRISDFINIITSFINGIKS